MDKLLNNDQIAVFYNDIENRNYDIAVKTLVELLQDISRQGISRQEQKRTNTGSELNKLQPWWDNELQTAKAIKYKCLRYMKQDNSGVSKSKYVAARNKFKSLV